MQFTFEGNYRPKRNINLGGVRSHEDKKTLMAKAQAERRARERERLETKSALKIQAFYRGRSQAGLVRMQQRADLKKRLEHVLQTHDDPALEQETLDNLVHCIRQLLNIARVRIEKDEASSFITLCGLLLSRCPTGKGNMLWLTRFLMANEQDGDELDSRIWLIILLSNRLVLPLLQQRSSSDAMSPRDYSTVTRFCRVITIPETYAAFSELLSQIMRDTYVRILTYIVVEGNLFRALRRCFENPALSTKYAAEVVLGVVSFREPYDYAESRINLFRPKTTQPFVRGLFSYSSTIAPPQSPPPRPHLDRGIICEKLVLDLLSLPFLLDSISDAMIDQILDKLPFKSALEVIIQLPESKIDNLPPEDIAGLTINLMLFASTKAGRHLNNAAVPYAKAMQRLLAILPAVCLAKEGHKQRTDDELESDIDSSAEDEGDISMKDDNTPSVIKVDQRIKDRLEALFEGDKAGSLVQWFMHETADLFSKDVGSMGPVSNLFSNLMIRWPSTKSTILNLLLYRRWRTGTDAHFAQQLWTTWLTTEASAIFNDDDGLLDNLNQAIYAITNPVVPEVWAIFYLLCEMYTRLLLTIGDDEFFDRDGRSNQLRLDQVVDFSRQLKNISFALFWKASSLDMDQSIGTTGISIVHFRNTVTHLLQQIHTRDSRRAFCAKDHWLIKKLDTDGFASAAVTEELEFENDSSGRRKEPSKGKLAVISPRLGVLNNIPFVTPFEQRVEIFRMFVENDRRRNNVDDFLQPRHAVTIRRDHVFEDGFTYLYGLGSLLKRRIAITFIDEFGLEEAGIDGGGVFKEFLTKLSHEAFDTNYGLFLTTPDQLLYPNPSEYATEPSQLMYFEFLGLIIGKALYDGILLDVAFADFFLKKCLGGVNHLDDLPSLDPELYHGLISVKNYKGNVEGLCLDFTITRDELGDPRPVELIPGGSNIPVTNENRIRYVYLVANYRLNVQISKQCKAFFRGLSIIIDVKWLRMFNQHELQVLLGGASVPIDIDDLRKHTVYAGYTEDDETIQNLWKVLYSFDNEQRRKFVKFVTSCSRPPLLGFKELRPHFCVRNAGMDDERLPTSSTCINLLKLPRFSSYDILKRKLEYAINAEAGFDLS